MDKKGSVFDGLCFLARGASGRSLSPRPVRGLNPGPFNRWYGEDKKPQRKFPSRYQSGTGSDPPGLSYQKSLNDTSGRCMSGTLSPLLTPALFSFLQVFPCFSSIRIVVKWGLSPFFIFPDFLPEFLSAYQHLQSQVFLRYQD